MREKSKCQFLAFNLKIHSMYELYHSEKGIEVKVGEQPYGIIFNTCFNPSLHKAKKDRCETCIEFENATPQQKTLSEEKYQTHLVSKTIARYIKVSEKLLSHNNPQSIACLAFDLQKVLNVSFGENALFFVIFANLLYIT